MCSLGGGTKEAEERAGTVTWGWKMIPQNQDRSYGGSTIRYPTRGCLGLIDAQESLKKRQSRLQSETVCCVMEIVDIINLAS